MRRILIIAIVTFLTIGTVVAVAYSGLISLGEPDLKLAFEPAPPWRLRPLEALEIDLGVENNAWTLATAKDVRVTIELPEGFSASGSTTQWQKEYGAIRGGESRGDTLSLEVTSNVRVGNYTISVRLQAANTREQVLPITAIIELPYIP
ncbi:MAG TPA: hypothetical protein VJ249_09505 [Candidatus Bathyarchaeia archaeon]|nr:hypothetical protein [Candidatus Bathyarchaeia archaeon]